jgi:hypothetical protein
LGEISHFWGKNSCFLPKDSKLLFQIYNSLKIFEAKKLSRTQNWVNFWTFMASFQAFLVTLRHGVPTPSITATPFAHMEQFPPFFLSPCGKSITWTWAHQ